MEGGGEAGDSSAWRCERAREAGPGTLRESDGENYNRRFPFYVPGAPSVPARRGLSPKMAVVRLFLAAFLTWICPGLGHLYLGRRGKAAYFFALVVGLFVVGMAFADFHNVSLERHPYFFIAYALLAGPTALAVLLTGTIPVETDVNPDLGCLLSAVAGLLNVLVMIDAYTIAEDPPPRLAPRPSTAAAAEVS